MIKIRKEIVPININLQEVKENINVSMKYSEY